MFRVAVASAILLVGVAVGAERPVAPAPRAKPDPSLVVIEVVPDANGRLTKGRVLHVGFRGGKMLPARTVWEGKADFLGGFFWSNKHQLVQDRFLVTQQGGVIDLRDRKVVHDEQDGELYRIDGTKVIYTRANRQEVGVYSFDLATRTRKYEHKQGEGPYGLKGVVSPDGGAAIESGPIADELILHQPGAKPKSLGKGFHIDVGALSSTFGPSPVLWLNDGIFLTQRANGELVTVDLAGKVTDVLTIKDAPKDLVSAPYLFRDGSNRIVYWCGKEAYSIDVAKKSWAKYEWLGLGHGFEASWEGVEKFGHKLRHNGKEFASVNCWPHTAKTAPGFLALEAQHGQERHFQPECVAVWSVAHGEWQTVECQPDSIVGWIK